MVRNGKVDLSPHLCFSIRLWRAVTCVGTVDARAEDSPDGPAVEAEPLQNTTGSERCTKKHVKEEGRVLLRLIGQQALTAYHEKPIAELSDGVDDIGGFEVPRLALVDVEDLRRVLHDVLKIDREVT